MTPTGIRLGRMLDSSAVNVSCPVGVTTVVLAADASRVGISVSSPQDAYASDSEQIIVGVVESGAIVPLLTLSWHLQSGYLSVDKLGSLVTGPVAVLNNTSAGILIGLGVARMTQELPPK